MSGTSAPTIAARPSPQIHTIDHCRRTVGEASIAVVRTTAAQPTRPLVRSRLVRGLRDLGAETGRIMMVHASMRALGWVVGGADTVVHSLLAAIGPAGTICAQVSSDDVPLLLARLPHAWQQAYRDECPVFDRHVSGAAPYEGRLAERIRTWPGAHRSAHPASGVAAVGPRARWLTGGHRLDDGFGPGSPYAKLVAANGLVLLLGAPLSTISLLHHAEAIADVAAVRKRTYEFPLLRAGRRRWVRAVDLDLLDGPYPYGRVIGDANAFEVIATAALERGIGTTNRIGDVQCHMFPATALVDFAVNWLGCRFASATARGSPVRHCGRARR